LLGRGRGPRARYYKGKCRDFYRRLCEQPSEFPKYCNFTVEQFEELHGEVAAAIERPRNTRFEFSDVHQIGRPSRPCKLNTRNRLLMVLMFLKNGGNLRSIGAPFDAQYGTVHLDIYHIVRIIMVLLDYEISWPPPGLSRNILKGTFEEFPNSIGCMDITHCEIRRPLENQHLYYRGDKKFHSLISQIVTAWDGYIMHIQTGYE
jgi:hypothetical protein